MRRSLLSQINKPYISPAAQYAQAIKHRYRGKKQCQKNSYILVESDFHRPILLPIDTHTLTKLSASRPFRDRFEVIKYLPADFYDPRGWASRITRW